MGLVTAVTQSNNPVEMTMLNRIPSSRTHLSRIQPTSATLMVPEPEIINRATDASRVAFDRDKI